MSFDAHANLAYTTVVTPPTPPSSGTTLIVASAAIFPATPFNAIVWPASAQATVTNAEIVRVTNISSNTLTITRTTEALTGGSARTILVGDQIANVASKKVFTDIEALATTAAADALNASALASGTVATARLGSGSATGSTFLRGDQAWATPVLALNAATITVKNPVRSADFTVDFTNDTEPLTGAHVVTLPTVVGNGGKRVTFVYRGTSGWTFTCNGAETIMGSASQVIFFGQYSSFTLEADANNALWDII